MLAKLKIPTEPFIKSLANTQGLSVSSACLSLARLSIIPSDESHYILHGKTLVLREKKSLPFSGSDEEKTKTLEQGTLCST